MGKNATEVVTLSPKLDNSGFSEGFYKVGQKRKNPAGHIDVVEKLVVIEDSRLARVEVSYEHYGEEHIMNHITFIHYEHADYRKIRNARKAAKEYKDSSGQQAGVDQDPSPQR